MKLTILTKEESIELWENEKKSKRCWTLDQIVTDARRMMSLPDMGNTKYILPNQYEDFYKWLETDEAIQQWNELPMTQHLAKYYSENKI